MKVMKLKRSCNENLRASAFDAKQMQLTVLFFFFFYGLASLQAAAVV